MRKSLKSCGKSETPPPFVLLGIPQKHQVNNHNISRGTLAQTHAGPTATSIPVRPYVPCSADSVACVLLVSSAPLAPKILPPPFWRGSPTPELQWERHYGVVQFGPSLRLMLAIGLCICSHQQAFFLNYIIYLGCVWGVMCHSTELVRQLTGSALLPPCRSQGQNSNTRLMANTFTQ